MQDKFLHWQGSTEKWDWTDSGCDDDVAGMFKQLENTKYDVIYGVSFSGRGLFRVPIGLCRFTTLRHLYLSSNRLTEIPSWLCKMTTLERLSIDDNDISRLPLDMGQLYRLKTLRCDENAKLPAHLQVRILEDRFQMQCFLRPFRCALKCQPMVIALLGTYRQWRVLRLPRDMVRVLARMIWDMRENPNWE